jgi:hypothetical protein
VKHRPVSLVILVLLAFVLGACGQGGALEQAKKAGCSALSGVGGAVASLQMVTPESTGKEIQEMTAKLDSTVQALKAANGVLKSEAIANLTTKYDSFSSMVNALPENEKLGQAADVLQPVAQQVQGALGLVTASLECGK